MDRLIEIATPQRMNNGAWYKQAHADFQAALLSRFGGFTEMPPVRGAWRDPATGKVYNDTMIGYRVAAPHSHKTIGWLHAKAQECFPDQLAFFISEIGEAIILPTHASMPHAVPA